VSWDVLVVGKHIQRSQTSREGSQVLVWFERHRYITRYLALDALDFSDLDYPVLPLKTIIVDASRWL
jgi:hypothetical protein